MPSFHRLPAHFALGALLGLSACAGVHQVDPASPSAEWTRQAGAIAARGNAASAMDFYRKALEADPQNVDALLGFAALEEKMKDWEAAGKHIRAALDVDSKNLDAHRAMGRVLLAQDHPKEAQEEYLKVLDRAPNDLKAMNGLAVCLDRLEKPEKAQKLLREALAKNPDDQATLNNLAYQLIRSGQPQEAIALLDPWLTRPQTRSALRENLALALAMAGDMHRAESVSRLDLQGPTLKSWLAFLNKVNLAHKLPEASETKALPFMEIGPFPTQGLAQNAIDTLLTQDGAEKGPKPDIVPILSPDGTPHFVVRVNGPDAAALQKRCEALQGHSIACRVP